MTGFGLYVHWPFCQSKCPYCDFNSHVSASVDHSAWSNALCAEIARSAEEIPDRTLTSIFFGGGTPSLMTPDTVARTIDTARAAWPWSNDVEITLEANPTSVEAGKFEAFKQAGVNRVSVGIQALNDNDLQALGRLHTATEARQAFDVARTTFERVSFDLIYARQNQSLAEWEAELSEALNMAADHLSLYQLTVESRTAFGDRHARGGLKGLPCEDLSADMFELTQTLTAEAGFPAYEISNHAIPGAESQHNLIYWRSEDWVGVGPGAHGRFTQDGFRTATEAYHNPAKWLSAVAHDGTGESARSVIPDDAYSEEILMMGLRLEEGIPLARVSDYLFGITDLQKQGLLVITNDRVKTSEKGKPLLNAILRALIA